MPKALATGQIDARPAAQCFLVCYTTLAAFLGLRSAEVELRCILTQTAARIYCEEIVLGNTSATHR